MLHRSAALGFVFCTCFTNYSTIFNSRVEHLEDFNGVLANHALIGDGAVALCPFRHLQAVVYRPNICNIFGIANEDVGVRYVVCSYNCQCNNTLFLLVAYESECFALDTVSIMSQNVAR